MSLVVSKTPSLGHSVLTYGSPERELDKKKKLVKENKKGNWELFLGTLARLLAARWLLCRAPRHRTLEARGRKEGARTNKKASSGNDSSEAKAHPDALSVVRGIK